ncbi:MAG: glycosyltransferase family 4 protein [Patescibacteria group bacterium]|jgi:glycosyltransferase involved in cell wall biosynthesis
MKFCLINNLYPPYSRGGAERVVEILAKGLQKKGEVFVITTQPTETLSCQDYEGINICRINPGGNYYLADPLPKNLLQKFFWHWHDLFNSQVLNQVKKFLQKNRPDFVFTHNLKGLSLGIPKVIRALGLKHIHTLHDYQLLDPHGSMHRYGKNLLLKNIFYVVYRYFTRLAIGNPDIVISPSQFVLNKHLEYGFFKNSQCVVLPNPVENFNNQKPQNKDLENNLRLLYLGQLEPHKGIKFLVETILKLDNSRLNLTVAGTGTQFELIKSLANKSNGKINVIGQVAREQLDDLFKLADLLVLPSLWWENSPMVILEAYSQKTPVLVSDVGGSQELVKEPETGWIFKSNSEVDLVDQLKMILHDKNNLPDMGQKAYDYVKSFSLENYLDKLISLCRNLKK